MPSLLVQASGKRLCQFPAIGVDMAGLVLEATPEEETPARLLILGSRLLGGASVESLTWFDDVLMGGTELSVTSVPSDDSDPPRENVRSDTTEGDARQGELQRAFAKMDAGTIAPRSVHIPLPWETLAFRVMAGDEVLCLAAVTEERPLLSLSALWDRWHPESLWLSASSGPQGWPPKPDEGHRWLDQRVKLDRQLRVTIIGEKPERQRRSRRLNGPSDR